MPHHPSYMGLIFLHAVNTVFFPLEGRATGPHTVGAQWSPVIHLPAYIPLSPSSGRAFLWGSHYVAVPL